MKRKDRDISLKYHEILQRDPEGAVKSFALINERLKDKEITFGEDILPTLLEPGFLDKSEIEIVNSMVGPFQIAIDKIIDIVIEKYTPASQTEKYLVNKVKNAIKIFIFHHKFYCSNLIINTYPRKPLSAAAGVPA